MKLCQQFLMLGIALCFLVDVQSINYGWTGCWLGKVLSGGSDLELLSLYLLASCRYRPANGLQLQFCGQAAKLNGMHLSNLYKCQQHLDETLCKREKTDDGYACTWVSYSYDPFKPGVCLPHKIGSPNWQGELLESRGTHVRSLV